MWRSVLPLVCVVVVALADAELPPVAEKEVGAEEAAAVKASKAAEGPVQAAVTASEEAAKARSTADKAVAAVTFDQHQVDAEKDQVAEAEAAADADKTSAAAMPEGTAKASLEQREEDEEGNATTATVTEQGLETQLKADQQAAHAAVNASDAANQKKTAAQKTARADQALADASEKEVQAAANSTKAQTEFDDYVEDLRKHIADDDYLEEMSEDIVKDGKDIIPAFREKQKKEEAAAEAAEHKLANMTNVTRDEKKAAKKHVKSLQKIAKRGEKELRKLEKKGPSHAINEACRSAKKNEYHKLRHIEENERRALHAWEHASHSVREARVSLSGSGGNTDSHGKMVREELNQQRDELHRAAEELVSALFDDVCTRVHLKANMIEFEERQERQRQKNAERATRDQADAEKRVNQAREAAKDLQASRDAEANAIAKAESELKAFQAYVDQVHETSQSPAAIQELAEHCTKMAHETLEEERKSANSYLQEKLAQLNTEAKGTNGSTKDFHRIVDDVSRARERVNRLNNKYYGDNTDDDEATEECKEVAKKQAEEHESAVKQAISNAKTAIDEVKRARRAAGVGRDLDNEDAPDRIDDLDHQADEVEDRADEIIDQLYRFVAYDVKNPATTNTTGAAISLRGQQAGHAPLQAAMQACSVFFVAAAVVGGILKARSRRQVHLVQEPWLG
eukprot:gnl/TRDRNA2_/TRDRNA2_177122_c0_seq1.p1 gnl/TRDRNA2_/TRDRNA2_177122_c0~~gnl/TRDRNA2_/TRDRNA2_177122_c0_seq1.p1  ORF type:complete len:715 (-),score=213.85 gnl/TRDRNA2_/TRDRNA2_177122_c0_seq1:160-2211(-)